MAAVAENSIEEDSSNNLDLQVYIWLADFVFSKCAQGFIATAHHVNDVTRTLCAGVFDQDIEWPSSAKAKGLLIMLMCKLDDASSLENLKEDEDEETPLEEAADTVLRLLATYSQLESILPAIKEQAVLQLCRTGNFERARDLYERLYTDDNQGKAVMRVVKSENMEHPVLRKKTYKQFLDDFCEVLKEIHNFMPKPFLVQAAIKVQRNLQKQSDDERTKTRNKTTNNSLKKCVEVQLSPVSTSTPCKASAGSPGLLTLPARKKRLLSPSRKGTDSVAPLSSRQRTSLAEERRETKEAEENQLRFPLNIPYPAPVFTGQLRCNLCKTFDAEDFDVDAPFQDRLKFWGKVGKARQSRIVHLQNMGCHQESESSSMQGAADESENESGEHEAQPRNTTREQTHRKSPDQSHRRVLGFESDEESTSDGVSSVIVATKKARDEVHKTRMELRAMLPQHQPGHDHESRPNTKEYTLRPPMGVAGTSVARDLDTPLQSLPGQKHQLPPNLIPKENLSDVSSSGFRRFWTTKETEKLYLAVQKVGVGNWMSAREESGLLHKTNINIKDRWRTMINKGIVKEMQQVHGPVPDKPC